jgi:putative transposase
MPRPPRIIDPEGYYHVYCRGNNRAVIFHAAEDYRTYLNMLTGVINGRGMRLFHYCLMPNHVHLLLQPSACDLPPAMHALHNAYAKYYCRKYEFVGHVWQGRYRTKAVESEAYLLACGNYIELNPLRAGLVARPEHWRFSSYRFYAFGNSDPVVTPNPTYLSLADDPGLRSDIFRRLAPLTRSN